MLINVFTNKEKEIKLMAELDYEYIAGLVKKAQKGNSDAFAEIYAATYQKQYKFTYQYVKDAYLAQDILQEVYILVLKNITKIKNPRLFISWLNQINFRICLNACKKRSQQVQELGQTADGQSLADVQAGESLNPEQEFARKNANEELMEKILSLPPHESQVIIMKYYNEMKLEEIASAMDISRSTVKRYLAHGRASLEKILGEQKGGINIG